MFFTLFLCNSSLNSQEFKSFCFGSFVVGFLAMFHDLVNTDELFGSFLVVPLIALLVVGLDFVTVAFILGVSVDAK